MSSYGKVPKRASLEVSNFDVAIPQDQIQDFLNLIRASRLGPQTYENTGANGRYGLTYEWMSEAKAYWENDFDWYAVENRINAFPNFMAKVVDDDGSSHNIHFAGLFSKRIDAIPIMCIHGWPGSFLEFFGILSALTAKYSPEELPYHVIVPSMPGYAFSAAPPVDKNWTMQDTGRLLHKLMLGLGFGDGYALQGGDIGSYTARMMASRYDTCKALHLNFCVMTCPDENQHGRLEIEDYEKEALGRGIDFGKFGTAYAVEHSTRPSTIGFVLSSSPLALLAWIGEKFLAWTDTTPSMDEILASVTLYWLTSTFPRSIYPYRQEIVEEPHQQKTDEDLRLVFQKGPKMYMPHADPELYCRQPFGYSFFPHEIGPVPKSWAATTGNMVWSNHHDKGGHFAAMEQPDALLADIEGFLKQVWVSV